MTGGGASIAGARHRPPVRPAVLIALGALAALGAVMQGGATIWPTIFVETELGGGPAIAGLCAAAITLELSVGRLIAHQPEHRYRDKVIIRASALLALPAFVILSLASSPPMALLGFFMAGVGVGPVGPAVFRSVSKRHPEADRGRAPSSQCWPMSGFSNRRP